MTRPDHIKTTDIDLSAAIMTLTMLRPALFPGRSMGDLSEIIFHATDEIILITQRYATGELLVPVKQLLVCRRTLATYAREVNHLRKGVEL